MKLTSLSLILGCLAWLTTSGAWAGSGPPGGGTTQPPPSAWISKQICSNAGCGRALAMAEASYPCTAPALGTCRTIGIAYYDDDADSIHYASSTDGGATFSVELVDAAGPFENQVSLAYYGKVPYIGYARLVAGQGVKIATKVRSGTGNCGGPLGTWQCRLMGIESHYAGVAISGRGVLSITYDLGQFWGPQHAFGPISFATPLVLGAAGYVGDTYAIRALADGGNRAHHLVTGYGGMLHYHLTSQPTWETLPDTFGSLFGAGLAVDTSNQPHLAYWGPANASAQRPLLHAFKVSDPAAWQFEQLLSIPQAQNPRLPNLVLTPDGAAVYAFAWIQPNPLGIHDQLRFATRDGLLAGAPPNVIATATGATEMNMIRLQDGRIALAYNYNGLRFLVSN